MAIQSAIARQNRRGFWLYQLLCHATQISSLPRRRPLFADSSLTPGSAVKAPRQLDWTSCSDQLANSVIPCRNLVRSKKALLKEQIFSRAELRSGECSHCKCFSLASLWWIAFFSESNSAPCALPFSSSQGPMRKKKQGRVEQPVFS